MPNKRGISPLTTWHSQAGLLLISASWGVSYLVPTSMRIPFSEVFPDRILSHTFAHSMHWWGAMLLIPAFIALVCERIINHKEGKHPVTWPLVVGSHMLLAATYSTLGLAALLQALSQVHYFPHWAFWGGLVSSISRTVLWAFIGWLHTTYARLPRPHAPVEETHVPA